MSGALRAVLERELRLAARSPAQLLWPLLFNLMVAVAFPLAVGADPARLAAVGPGVIWVAAVLATLLGLEALFKEDLSDGSLEQWALSPLPLGALLGAKIAAHWLLAGLPLVVMAPLLGLLFSLSGQTIVILVATLCLGTPVLCAVGALGAALTVGLRNGAALAALLLLPLYVPVLIFGAGAANAVAQGLPVTGQLYFLGGLCLLALSLAPPAVAAAIRLNLDA